MNDETSGLGWVCTIAEVAIMSARRQLEDLNTPMIMSIPWLEHHLFKFLRRKRLHERAKPSTVNVSHCGIFPHRYEVPLSTNYLRSVDAVLNIQCSQLPFHYFLWLHFLIWKMECINGLRKISQLVPLFVI